MSTDLFGLSADVDVASVRRRRPTAHEHGAGQYPTPAWLCEAIIQRYFNDLSSRDVVWEPTCGVGRFLSVLPAHVPAFGTELDPLLAAEARQVTGRRVLTGDALTVSLDVTPTVALGNPPFARAWFSALLARLETLLPPEGRAGFLLPVTYFATSRSVMAWARSWSIFQEFVPRDVYHRLSQPLCFALFAKARRRTLVGFAFYPEAASVADLPPGIQDRLTSGRGGGAWWPVVRWALEQHGGEATLTALYDTLSARRPTPNQYWKDTVRRILQEHAVRVRKGTWRLAA